MDDFLTVYQQTRRMARSFPAETGKKEEKNKKNIKKFLKGGREPRRADCASAHGHGPVPVGHWRGYTQKIPPLRGGLAQRDGVVWRSLRKHRVRKKGPKPVRLTAREYGPVSVGLFFHKF